MNDAVTHPDPYTALRPRLYAIAYRMLGTRPGAEDVLQDAWLRWHRAERSALQSAEAWLVTVVTRLPLVRLNGEAGLLRYVDGQLESAQAFVTDRGRITAIHTARNPDKLAGSPPLDTPDLSHA